MTDFKFNVKLVNFMAFLACMLVGMRSAGDTVQYVTLTCSSYPSTTMAVKPCQLITPVGYDYEDGPSIYATTTNGSTIWLDTYSAVPLPIVVTGLSKLTVSVNPANYAPRWATFKITTPDAPNVVSNYVPADAIVIPASATGPVQIILESSPDLVNWTAANPGTYGASAGTNRFFRVRAQIQ